MNLIIITIIFLLNPDKHLCENINKLFEDINIKTTQFNIEAAAIAWNSSIDPGNADITFISEYQRQRILWQRNICETLATLQSRHLLDDTQERQTYLLCRGPKFTFDEARILTSLYNNLQSKYSDVEICIPVDKNISKDDLEKVENAIIHYIYIIKKVFEPNKLDTIIVVARNAIKAMLHYINNINKIYERPNKLDTIIVASKIAINNKVIYGGNKLCFDGEEDFERIMAFSKKEEVLRWLWSVWREKVGPNMKVEFKKLVRVENKAARRNGYPDIGAAWREELEIPNLRELCRQLLSDIQPLYKLLHGVTRFYLRRHYGDIVPERGPIPAHLLGNLWSQSWESIIDLITPINIDLDSSIRRSNWTVFHMAKRAEDFYESMGLSAMTDTFWQKSVLSRETNETRCHGAAADMFRNDDYRLLYCSGVSWQDFYVLHHEMGHIEYYMAYENQPGLFRQANAALHESIGDTIMIGAMTPQHLHRLGLINDSILYINEEDNIKDFNSDLIDNNAKEVKENNINNILHENFDNIKTHDLKNKKEYKIDTAKHIKVYDETKLSDGYKEINDLSKTVVDTEELDFKDAYQITTNTKTDQATLDLTSDQIIMLKQALNKIPHIPFSLIIDEYRWKYFEGGIQEDIMNQVFWDLVEELSGIAPPTPREEEYFDVAAKFHVPDNTPYIRYFLSSFIQHQLFESLCKASVFGRRNVGEDIPKTILMNRCDIYGSRTAGKILKDLMTRGHSQHWKEILQQTTGYDNISATSLLKYYRPLQNVLEAFVNKHQIPIGW